MLTEREIVSIEVSIKALQATGNPVTSGLRSLFPNISFVRCSVGDMDALPYRFGTRYQLYLMDHSEGCIRVTDRLESADGVIVAEME